MNSGKTSSIQISIKHVFVLITIAKINMQNKQEFPKWNIVDKEFNSFNGNSIMNKKVDLLRPTRIFLRKGNPIR